jgi:hypothetical protein
MRRPCCPPRLIKQKKENPVDEPTKPIHAPMSASSSPDRAHRRIRPPTTGIRPPGTGSGLLPLHPASVVRIRPHAARSGRPSPHPCRSATRARGARLEPVRARGARCRPPPLEFGLHLLKGTRYQSARRLPLGRTIPAARARREREREEWRRSDSVLEGGGASQGGRRSWREEECRSGPYHREGRLLEGVPLGVGRNRSQRRE